MRVVVREAFTAYINMQPEAFAPGQTIKGDTAVQLLRSGAAVDPDDDAARELHATLEGDADDGQEQEGDGQQDGDGEAKTATQSPAESGSNPDDGPGNPDPSQPPAPSHDAPVKDLLAWVGDDPSRARELLGIEEAKDQPRSTLVKQLQKIAEA
ncbi:hypothetical protein [Streptomyces sp. bgisy034]|uniref:hypothetical protein n=1 Tax=Streptomyces sp. bgisy034 TaxID=3413774 RepID=UPI003EB7B760